MNILNSKVYGRDLQATPVLVLHGLFGMLDNWGSFARHFSNQFPIHLLDLRNHGKSFHSDEMSIEAMVQDLQIYLQHNKLEQVVLLGHSLGGKVVMQFAMTYPKQVEKLIVADMAPKAYPPHHQGIFKGLNSVDLNHLTDRREAEEEMQKYIPDERVIQFLAKNLYWNKDKRLQWRFNLPVLTESYNGIVTRALPFGTYPGPTLFLGGENSNYILPQDEFLIKQEFPMAQIKTIPNSGHWIHADNPTAFFADVAEFLNR